MTRPAWRLGAAIALAALAPACGDSSRNPPSTVEPQSRSVAATSLPAAASAPSDAASPAGAEAPPVTEADLGLALYPGATLLQAQSTREVDAGGGTVLGIFEVNDSPASVAAFYRQQLRDRADGQALMENTTDAGHRVLMLDDTRANRALQVQIMAAGRGAHVEITAVQFPPR